MRLLAIPIFLRDGPGLVVHSGIDLGGFSPLMQEMVSDGICETVLENGLTDVRTITRIVSLGKKERPILQGGHGLEGVERDHLRRPLQIGSVLSGKFRQGDLEAVVTMGGLGYRE